MDHLDLCADCRQIVASLSGDDFLDRLRQAHGPGSTPAPEKSLGGVQGSPKPPPEPTTLFNLPAELANNPQYDILRELGKGGMGVVYLAKNRLMDRPEVLKVINKALLDRPGAVERFLREIRAAARLSHVNVVAAYSALQLGDLLVFAMEYVEGQDLAAVVKAGGPLPVPHACFYVQQAAHGLQHAFEKGMAHRDIKPQNLILAREGRKHLIKVLDFGLAKVFREKADDAGLTGAGRVLGTPDYMAPEQTLDAASADIRADIYSLGCTLYFLLSGDRPFKGKSLFEIMQAHQSAEAPALDRARSDVPAGLAAVVRKMMAKDRAQRYQTPLEVVAALGPFVRQAAQKPSSPSSSGSSLAAPAASGKPPQPEARTGSAVPPAAPPRGEVVGERRSPAVKTAARKKWLVGGAVAAVVLSLTLLGMWAGGVLKVKTKDGTIVLKNVPPGAEVTVDGGEVTLQTAEGDSFAVRIAAGKKQRLQVKKAGFTTFGEEVEIEAGGRRPITVRMEPLPAVRADPTPVVAPDLDRQVAEWVLDRKGTVRVIREGGEKEEEVGPDQKLPAGHFRLVEVKLLFRSVGDAGLAKVKGLTHLRNLILWDGDGGITDDGLAHLKDMRSIRYLGLNSNPRLTDAGLVHLSGLTDLDNLDLNCSAVTDAGMVHLGRLTNLSELNLMATRTTGSGFGHLEKLTKLKLFLLAGSWVGDEGLAHIGKLKHLNRLGLDRTRVTDAGLVHLKGLKELRVLWLPGTKVTKAGVADLQKALPACHIIADNIVGVAPPKQLEEVRARLKELNPGFDGKIDYELAGQDVVKLKFSAVNIKDISPVRALRGLQSFGCSGDGWNKNGQLADLSPLRGMKLTLLWCAETQVTDLSPLEGMPLKYLECNNTHVSDLSPLKGMPLEGLNVFGTQVVDLAPLRGMPLKTLNVSGTPVADLSPIKDLKLTSFICNASQVTAAGLGPLHGMSGLRHLEMGGEKMTEEALASLKNFPDLESLWFLDSPLTRAGLKHVRAVKSLKWLNISGTRLSDEDLVLLEGLLGLRMLILDNTRVTDAGLDHLVGLKNLELLGVERTAVTVEGVAKLKAALPRCNIRR